MIVGITSMTVAPAASAAASAEGTVTGVGSGAFPGRANFAGIDLRSFEIATGVITDSDGSATGVFYAVLSGRTLLGTARVITLEGNATQGLATPGSGNFSGLARLDLGDGVPAISGVPFNVDVRDGSMVLTIQSTVLPSATFNQGGMDVGQ